MPLVMFVTSLTIYADNVIIINIIFNNINAEAINVIMLEVSS